MKKKTYIQPSIEEMKPAIVLMHAGSIDNTGDGSDVQKPIGDNDDDDFDAGAKGSGFDDLWDE